MRYGDGVNVAKQWCGRKVLLEEEATLAMFIDNGGMLIGVAGGMALFAGVWRRCAHCFRSIAPVPTHCDSPRGAQGMRSASTACIRGPMPCALPTLVYRSCLPNSSTSKVRACVAVEKSRILTVGPDIARPVRFQRSAMIGKEGYSGTYALTAFWVSQPWLLSTRTAALRSMFVKLMN